MTSSASRKESYKVEFTAIPSDRQFRMPLLEDSWPLIQGVVTGTIASTKGYVGPYIDGQGRYIVNLHADRDERTPGLESCPMRLAKPFGGQGRTGFHFGLEAGTIVTVGFLWGNPDRPYISQVLHTAKHMDPVVSGHPWAQRHTIHTRSNNTLQMEDRKGQEHIKLATENGKSQLNLGFAVDRDNQGRSEGYDVGTDIYRICSVAGASKNLFNWGILAIDAIGVIPAAGNASRPARAVVKEVLLAFAQGLGTTVLVDLFWATAGGDVIEFMSELDGHLKSWKASIVAGVRDVTRTIRAFVAKPVSAAEQMAISGRTQVSCRGCLPPKKWRCTALMNC